MQLRDAYTTDLEQLALCHISSFPKSLSSAMGKKYVAKMLEWYLVFPKAFIFCIEDNNKIVGYCGGMINDGTSEHGSASSMTQHSFNAAVIAILLRPWLFFHPEMMNKYFFTLKNIFNKIKRKFIKYTPNLEKAKTSEPKTGLIVIGVHQSEQGKGIGGLLLEEFENKSKKLNIHKMYLTVKADNFQAIKAYEKAGWIKEVQNGNSLKMNKNTI